MSSRSSDLRPALAASVGLHLLAVLAGLIALKSSPPIETPPAMTAVTIVTRGPQANVSPAVQAAQAQSAASPQPSSPQPEQPEPPAPEKTLPPEPPAPAPQPRRHREATPAPRPVRQARPAPTPRPEPASPRSRPQPRPAPKPALRPEPEPTPEPRPQPAPKPRARPASDLDLGALTRTAPKRPAKALDLSSLSSSRAAPSSLDLTSLASASPRSPAARTARADLDLASLAAGGHRASAKGPARAETARIARQATGAALTGDQIGALKEKLNRLWHPNCGIEGASGVDIKVELRLTPDHQLAGPPRVLGKTSAGAGSAVVDAAAQRALTAAAQGAPYTELPKTAPLDFALHFDAKQACNG